VIPPGPLRLRACGGDQRERWVERDLNRRAEATTFAFPGGPESIGAAREHAHAFLLAVDPAVPAATTQDVLLAVSEMVTNAVRYAPGEGTLEISLDEQQVRISVTDTSRDVPQTREARFDGSGGFGLHLLHALAGHVETVRHAGGKTVSVCLDRASRTSGRACA
jgi:anti-sigma regulatory factor (Ser/Thr protein kinase)